MSAEACLARIRADDRAIGAVVALDEAKALKAAAESARRHSLGQARSAIDGMPILVKANIALEGLPWSAGIGAYRDRLATRDAACVARLRAAGAIILGLTNMDEGALGASTDNPWFGRTDNPAAPGHSAGGSSGGSAAAVAAGFCQAALGTDTIGSVRIPASYCGVFGHKPARGAIPTEGIVPLSPSLDTVGVLAGSAALCRMVAAIASGDRPAAPVELGSVRLALLDESALSGVAAGLFDATLHRARRCGMEIAQERIAPPSLDRLQKLLFMLAEIEGAEVHGEALRRDPDGFSPAFRVMLEWGAAARQPRFAAIHDELSQIGEELQQVLRSCDALLLPTTRAPAFAAGESPPADQAALVSIASCLGWPATAFPIGRSPAGLPLSAQIVARDEALCLALAESLADDGSATIKPR